MSEPPCPMSQCGGAIRMIRMLHPDTGICILIPGWEIRMNCILLHLLVAVCYQDVTRMKRQYPAWFIIAAIIMIKIVIMTRSVELLLLLYGGFSFVSLFEYRQRRPSTRIFQISWIFTKLLLGARFWWFQDQKISFWYGELIFQGPWAGF